MVNVEELPQNVLVKILSYLKYDQLVSLRQVSQTFRTLCSELLNVAFLNLQPILQKQLQDVQSEIKATDCPKRLPSLLFHYKIVQILEAEHRVLLTVCGRHVTNGTYCFVGGNLLNYFYKLSAITDIDNCETLERSVTVQLFLLCEDFADYFEEYVEPTLGRDRHSLLGTRIVDLMDCFLDSNYHLIVNVGDDGCSSHVVGGYEVYSSADGISSPPLAKAPVNGVDKVDVTRLVRYLRNTVRWHNLCHCIDATSKRMRGNKQRRRRLCLDQPGSVVEDIGRGDQTQQKVFKRGGCRGEGKGFVHGLACSLDLRCMNELAPRRTVSSMKTSCKSEVPEIASLVGRKSAYEFTMKLQVRYTAVEDVEEVTKEVQIQLHETDNVCFLVEHTAALGSVVQL